MTGRDRPDTELDTRLDAVPDPPVEAPTPVRTGRWSRRLIGPFTLGHVVTLLAALGGTAILVGVLTTPVGAPAPTLAPRPGASFYVIGDRTEGLAVGQMAPELAGVVDGRAVTLDDLDGHPVSLAALRGRPVWVSFWASWCPPCQAETPVLRDVAREYAADGLAMIAVSVQETSPEDVKQYAETYALPYTIAFDGTSGVFHAWQGYGLPTHYLIDAEGVIRAVHYGPVSMTDAERLLATVLPADGSPGASAPVPQTSGSNR